MERVAGFRPTQASKPEQDFALYLKAGGRHLGCSFQGKPPFRAAAVWGPTSPFGTSAHLSQNRYYHTVYVGTPSVLTASPTMVTLVQAKDNSD